MKLLFKQFITASSYFLTMDFNTILMRYLPLSDVQQNMVIQWESNQLTNNGIHSGFIFIVLQTIFSHLEWRITLPNAYRL